MPTKTCPANKSSLFAVTGSTELGGGQDRHLTVGGPWNGYTFTSAVRFGFDWSDVRRINAATLRLRTSAQVHVGFSSTPDVYVARATADWTANGSSSSAEGGSGWGTSPTVYPGPPSTTTGRVSKRAPTGEGVDLFIDITAIVRAWAPATVEGGGAALNYGIVLSRVASGDTTEFASYAEPSASLRPYITLDYATDTPPPAPTIVAPSSGSTTPSLRPMLSATAVDPDGDPLTDGDVEVYNASHVRVYSAIAFAASGPTTLDHTPVSDLPPGALTVRFRARAAGVYGAWSAESPFTVDRPPTVTGWTAPTGNVSGTRRPVHTFNASDPDATAIDQYDIEVYATIDGSTPAGAAVYVKTGQSTGIAGGTISHTPDADLPGGPLLARSRVHSGPAWSAWSAFQPYTIVLTSSTIVWIRPAAVGAGLAYRASQFSDLAVAVGAHQMRADLTVTPPAGKTISASSSYRIVQLDGVYGSDALNGEGGFEVTPAPAGWSGNLSLATFGLTAGDAPEGTKTLKLVGDGVVNNPTIWKFVPAVPGATYIASVQAKRVGGTLGARLAIDTRDGAGAITLNRAFVDIPNSQTAFALKSTPGYTVPTDGSVVDIRWRVQISGVAAVADDWRFDAGKLDPGGAGSVIASGALGAPAAGGAVSLYGAVLPGHASNATRWRVDVTVNDSGGGVATASRTGGVSYGEWFGSTALGDSASALAVVETILAPVSTPDLVALAWYRAQSSPTAAAGAAPWRPASQLATLVGELPATNAYLGLRVRMNRVAPPPQLVQNPSFETSLAPNWGIGGGAAANVFQSAGVAGMTPITGAWEVAMRVEVAGVQVYIEQVPRIPLVAGQTYRLSAWVVRRVGAGGPMTLRADSYSPAGAVVATSVVSKQSTAAIGVWTYLEGYYTAPADGSVATLRVLVGVLTAASNVVGDYWFIDDVQLYGAAATAVEGFDKLALTWKSLG